MYEVLINVFMRMLLSWAGEVLINTMANVITLNLDEIMWIDDDVILLIICI